MVTISQLIAQPYIADVPGSYRRGKNAALTTRIKELELAQSEAAAEKQARISQILSGYNAPVGQPAQAMPQATPQVMPEVTPQELPARQRQPQAGGFAGAMIEANQPRSRTAIPLQPIAVPNRRLRTENTIAALASVDPTIAKTFADVTEGLTDERVSDVYTTFGLAANAPTKEDEVAQLQSAMNMAQGNPELTNVINQAAQLPWPQSKKFLMDVVETGARANYIGEAKKTARQFAQESANDVARLEDELRNTQLRAESNQIDWGNLATRRAELALSREKFNEEEITDLQQQVSDVYERGTPEYKTMMEDILRAKAKGQEITFNQGQDKFLEKMGEKEVTDFFETKEKARSAAKSLQSVALGTKILDEGMITGWGADFMVNAGNALQKLGVNIFPEARANTEAYGALMAQNTAQILQDFGQGTGLSDADRVYSEKAAAGKVDMTEEALRKILLMNEYVSKNAINTYNKMVDQLPPGSTRFQHRIEPPAGVNMDTSKDPRFKEFRARYLTERVNKAKKASGGASTPKSKAELPRFGAADAAKVAELEPGEPYIEVYPDGVEIERIKQ